jgi:metal-responsive CopG/Arc/MetJ family transcriptional regulator
MPNESVQMTVSLPRALLRQAVQVAGKGVRSRSDLLREALHSYVGQRQLAGSARKALARALRRKGIRNSQDLDRLIHAARS